MVTSTSLIALAALMRRALVVYALLGLGFALGFALTEGILDSGADCYGIEVRAVAAEAAGLPSGMEGIEVQLDAPALRLLNDVIGDLRSREVIKVMKIATAERDGVVFWQSQYHLKPVLF